MRLMRITGLSVIILLGIGLYGHVMHSSFHMDDAMFIQRNEGIRDITQWQDFGKGAIAYHSRYVTFATFAVNYAIHGFDVFGYHITNLAIHIFATLLAWWLAFLIIEKVSYERFKEIYQQRRWLSFAVALLFLVHPIQTQAVTYISQRFASLATLFYLLSIAAYLHGRLRASGSKSIVFFTISMVSTLLAVHSKEIGVTIPLTILFFEMVLVQKDFSLRSLMQFLRKNIILVLIFLFLGLVLAFHFDFKIRNMIFGNRISGSHDGDVFTFWTYGMTQCRVLVTFLRLMFFPVGQNIDYDFPMSHGLFNPASTFMSLSVLIAMIWFGARYRLKVPGVFIGVMWFFLTLSVNFIPRQYVIFEHKMYLASFGICFAFVWYVAHCVHKIHWRYIIFIICIIALGFTTYERNKVWQTELSLWSDAVKKSPNKFSANLNAGKAYLESGEYDKAIHHFNRALEIKPDSTDVLGNRGRVHHKIREYKKAMVDFNKAINLEPDANPEVYSNRGILKVDVGQFDAAILDYKKAIELNPDYPEFYNNLGNAYLKKGMLDDALKMFSRALELPPTYSIVFFNIAKVYLQLKQPAKALEYLNQAIDLKPNEPYYITIRGNLYMGLNKFELALEDYNRAIELNPSLVLAWLRRGDYYHKMNNRLKAMADYKQVITLDQNNRYARQRLAELYK